MSNVIIIGAGAAGLMAAYAAGTAGHRVHIMESNEKAGKKIYITGKGRCNYSNSADFDAFMDNVVSNPKFLYSALKRFDESQMTAFLESHGCRVKEERGGRMFPISDHASDVTAALLRSLSGLNVTIDYNTKVSDLIIEEGTCRGVICGGREFRSDAVIIATGGMSYPSTGSTGDGYTLAEKAGHTIVALRPSLVPLETREDRILSLQGLSLKNVTFSVFDRSGKRLYKEFGEMLFTHFGVSGPIVLSASAYIGKTLSESELRASIDLKPALDESALDKRLLRDISESPQKKAKNFFDGLLPMRLSKLFFELWGEEPEKSFCDITKESRKKAVHLLKDFSMIISGTRGFKEAIITQGGVNVKEINSKTMESKKLPGLFFAGEVMDVDALTGGFNLQIAFSTGFAAGGGIS
jgi:predicted Rossmann fold flavoprotein